MEKLFFIYILASKKHGTLYIGVTNNLIKRVWEHKQHVVEGFTKTYDVTNLVYYESFPDSVTAIKREHQLKEWQREWKIKLIEEQNPDWADLYHELNR